MCHVAVTLMLHLPQAEMEVGYGQVLSSRLFAIYPARRTICREKTSSAFGSSCSAAASASRNVVALSARDRFAAATRPGRISRPV